MAFYALDEFDLGERFKINAEMRYTQFMQAGPYTRYTFDLNDKRRIASAMVLVKLQRVMVDLNHD
ncbi:MAG: hypothetical protein IPN26_13525 [Bacteroidetes bacterium]|nr:hypothetical protein [Bacteroidota bacterium]